MHVLFFVEPFPVRLAPLDFLWVVDRWANTAKQLARLGARVSWAGSNAVAAARPTLSMLSPERLGFALDETDPRRADATWVELMRDECQPTWSPFIRALVDAVVPDAIITWTVNAPLRRVCRERGVVLMHQELGPLRPPHVPLFYADPCGVNGASAVREVWPELVREPFTARQQAELDEWLTRVYQVPDSRQRVRERLGLHPGKKVLGIFTQVARDSNVLAWSRVGGARELVETLVAAAPHEAYDLIVKRHPAEALPELPPGVGVVPDDLPATEVLPACDVVATINSSVAFEALLQEKPVYAFGDGPFAVGAAREGSSNVEALATSLATQPASLTSAELEARNRLCWFLVFRYFRIDDALAQGHSLLSTLENWQRLQARGASLLEYFSNENVSMRLSDDLRMVRQRSLEKLAHEQALRLEATEKQLEQLKTQYAGVEREQSNHISALTEALESRSNELAQVRQAIENLEHERSATRDALTATQQTVTERDARIQVLEDQLQALEGSTGVRVIRALQRLPVLYPSYLELKQRARSRRR